MHGYCEAFYFVTHDFFSEFHLVFLEDLGRRKAPVISWESLSRSLIIDLGSHRPREILAVVSYGE